MVGVLLETVELAPEYYRANYREKSVLQGGQTQNLPLPYAKKINQHKQKVLPATLRI